MGFSESKSSDRSESKSSDRSESKLQPECGACKKIVFLGETGVGKTSFILRLISDEFEEGTSYGPYKSLRGRFAHYKMLVDCTTLKLDIWDTLYIEERGGIPPFFCNRADAAIVVYDVTAESTFDKMTYLIEELKKELSTVRPGFVLAVVGNKSDLCSERVVSREKAEGFVKGLSSDDSFKTVIYRECSPKTGEGIRELFEDICRNLPPSS